MKKAVMYGAGKIGRGFIGKVFSDSGYEVVFLDILPELVDELNRRGEYPVRVISNAETQDFVVRPVRALLAATQAATEEIASCDLLATAVGVNNLPDIAPWIAKAAIARMERGGGPLDVILCENQLDVDELMRGWVYPHFSAEQRAWAERNLGLVEPTIIRMVPPMTEEMRAEDALLVCVDPYDKLPVDRAGFRGEIPDLKGLLPYAPFELCIKWKLFLNNGGHALCAYLAHQKGYEYIWQAVADPEIYEATKAAMSANARALIRRFGNAVREDVTDSVVDLLFRFQNRALKDTVARVGADPLRKLRRNDRLVGAALFCMEQEVDPAPIVRGIAAALKFDREDDPSAMRLQRTLAERGLDCVFEQIMGLRPDEPLAQMIREAYAK